MSRRGRPTAIAWLSRPVPLLGNGSGPRVLGVAQDALLGKALFRDWERKAEAAKGERSDSTKSG